MDKQGLRFAAIVRVSTERQAKRGESLNVQKKHIEDAVKYSGGTIYKWFTGHEHATPDYERKLLDELMREVKEKPKENFDAIMVYSTSRWMRDNLRHAEYIKLIRDNGIRFFVLTSEKDLYNAREDFLLTLDVAINQLNAQEINIAATHSKIARAQKNQPSNGGGKLFGRTFTKETGKWDVDEPKKRMVLEWSRLYLEEDVSFRELGKLYGMNPSNIHKTLTERCGTKWSIKFNEKALRKIIPVELEVPELLPESTIQRIKEKCKARKTWQHGFQKYQYLFSRIIFDKDTGYALTGTANTAGKRYYRPYRCNGKRYSINADILERAVLNSFFEALGWNKSLSDTMFEEFPAIENTEILNNEKNIYEKELKSFENKQTNIINAIEDYKHDDTSSSFNALKTKLKYLDEGIANLKFKIQTIENQLLMIPTKQEISDRLKQAAKDLLEIEKGIIEDHKMSYARSGNIFHDLPFIEKQKLIKLIFGGQDELGKKYGIYLRDINGKHKRYEFMAYGRLGNIKGCIESKESYSYPDNEIYISDYPEEIRKDVRKIVRVSDNNKERMLCLHAPYHRRGNDQ
ncbi:MAG: recombinase family protein [Smithella sp.]|jgi:DNA invertase Pin-like site-specific DNA recombinase